MFQKPEEEKHRHLKPLYMKGFVDGKPMTKMLVDGNANVNLMPYTTYRKLGKTHADLVKIDMTLKDFGGNPSQARGILNVEFTIGSKTLPTTLLLTGRGLTTCSSGVIRFMPIASSLQLCTNARSNGKGATLRSYRLL